MIAVDTSVAVAALGEWHELHRRAVDVLDAGPAVPVHALLETWSVLTGFPPPHRAPMEVVREWLEDRFKVVLDPPEVEEQRALVRQMAELGRPGGAIYDALIGLTARRAGATLISADRRAAAIYDLLEVPFEML